LGADFVQLLRNPFVISARYVRVGDSEMLQMIREASQLCLVKLTIRIVQPGFSKAHVTPSRQTTSPRGNRFYRRPQRSHCFGLSTIFLKAKCATSSETLDDEWQPDFWVLTA
jgi:hypothetical protein